ncbi:MAG: hypothetical protein K6D02_09445 [Lachnospiraceae bacterium]|nr:hypothetical protein [Lachnospiraceae bacterium]
MNITEDDKSRFLEAKKRVLGDNILTGGIGTLGEKTTHAVLKNFYEPDTDNQEIPIGKYYADIFRDGEIIEIQTRGLDKLRKKLDAFLPEYPVTVVHPIVHRKNIYWMDKETGEIFDPVKSPKRGNVFHAFRELYKLKMYLNNDNLNICILLIDGDEYRYLNTNPNYRKKHTERFDLLPTSLVDEYVLSDFRDYVSIIPESIPEVFDSKIFAKELKLTRGTASLALNVLHEVNAVKKVGKKGNLILYERQSIY